MRKKSNYITTSTLTPFNLFVDLKKINYILKKYYEKKIKLYNYINANPFQFICRSKPESQSG